MSAMLEIDGFTVEVRRSLSRKTLGLTVDRGGELVLHSPEHATDDKLVQWTYTKTKLLAKFSAPPPLQLAA